jgi:N-acetyl-anhydromuramyl-L-alanine amidase AmpD
MDIKKNITLINQFKGRFGYDIKAIVMHSCGGYYKGTIQWFRNAKAQASANYIISKTGEISLCVPEENAAWHTGMSNQELSYSLNRDDVPDFVKENKGVNFNFISLGIEIEDERNRKWAYPDPQYKACVELVADICKRYNLKADRKHILMHKEINPLNKVDPIGQWKHDKFIQDVAFFLDAEETGFTPVTVVSKTGLNVREDATLKADIKYFLDYGKTLYVKGFVIGDNVSDNNKWWKTKDNLFVWSGGTSMIPEDLKGLKVTIDERDQKLKEFESRASVIEARRVELEEAVKFNQADAEAYKAEWEAFASEPVETPVEVVAEPVVEEVVAEPVVEVAVEEDPKTLLAKLMAEVEALKTKLGL